MTADTLNAYLERRVVPCWKILRRYLDGGTRRVAFMVRMRLDISGPAYPEIGEAPAVWPRNTNAAAVHVA